MVKGQAREGERSKYRIALLVDDLCVSRHVRDIADWANGHPAIELVALIIHPAPQSTERGFAKFVSLARRQGLYTAVSRAAFAAVARLERRLLLRGRYAEPGPDSIGDRCATHLHTRPIVSRSGFVYRFSKQDVARIAELRLDALVRCGNGILKGDILTVARDGIISMHHADNRVNRGGPAGFWEVFHGLPQTGFIVQRLNEELDGGEVLFRGSISTALTFSHNHANLNARANTYLKRTIERLADGSVEPETPHLYDGRIYRTPLLHETLGYLLRTAGRVAAKVVKRSLGQEWHWGVAVTFQPWRSAVMWRAKCLPQPAGSFIADPFVLKDGDSHVLFVEQYRYDERKGAIAAYRIGPDRVDDIGIVLEEPWHLSFPFVFRHGDTVYMVPESMADRSLKLYRADPFPARWTLVKTIMADTLAADTVIFQRDGRWWLLTSIQGEGQAANDSELCAFHADDPTGEWLPHSRNPIVMDAGKGRNGGLLRDEDGNFYRVAQRHGFARYGIGVSIYRIEQLTADTYEETLIQQVQPNFFRRLAGFHHLHHDSGLTVFDYYRKERPR